MILEAVLLDVDGVVTDTARAHGESWKRLFDAFLRARADGTGEPFVPFDLARDFRGLVDGKPRLDGIRDFLASRGLTLPEGAPDDPAGAATVHGLGAQKQRLFEGWLEANHVEAYPGTRRLLRELDARGIPAAVFSSSRNAARVLASAGVADRFAAKVDGEDLVTLGLPGKPHPAMLREAAARLGVAPERCAVVEDATAGVEAGVRGGFGFVVGVARGENEAELRRAGADLVVRDLAELTFGKEGELSVKTLASVPSVFEREAQLEEALAAQRLAVFLDYDGTLTPIVEDPDRALLSDAMRDVIAALARRASVTIITGRGLARIARLVGLDSVTLAGSHGFEIAMPSGARASLEMGVELLPALDEAERRLRGALATIPGHQVERKRFSIAVHYRRAAADAAPRVEAAVDRVVAEVPGLRKGLGKKVFRVGPDLDWDKGRAVCWILERLDRDGPGHVPIYVGDDVTDEDAFRALAERGVTVVVRDETPRATAADYGVRDVDEVRRWLAWLAGIAGEGGRS